MLDMKLTKWLFSFISFLGRCLLYKKVVPERDLESQSGNPGNSDSRYSLEPRFSLPTLLRFRPLLRSFVDPYFINFILAESSVIMRFRVGEKLIEFPLILVIARVAPEKRAFPLACVVYEPPPPIQTEADCAIESYDARVLPHGAFDTVELEMLFPTAGKLVVLPLESNDAGTRVHQYRRFETFEGGMPVELFLKDYGSGKGGVLKMHCASVPVEFVRACLAGKGGPMVGVRDLGCEVGQKDGGRIGG